MIRIPIRTIILFAAATCLLPTAWAGEPWHELLGPCVPDCIGKWCRDDYCPKKEPCVCVPLRFQCDDYCAKKQPCVCPKLCFTCDNYCKKCLPKVCSPPRCDVLKCGPSCCASGHAASHVAEKVRSKPATLPESAKSPELPTSPESTYQSIAEAVADHGETFDAHWRPSIAEGRESVVGK